MYLIINLIFSGVICYFLTRRKSMSFGWAWFFSICFSLFIGTLLVLKSGKYGESTKKDFGTSSWQRTKFISCLLLGPYLLYVSFSEWPSSYQYLYGYRALEQALLHLFWGFGFIGSALYIYSDADTYVHEDITLEYLEQQS
jgi:hypothetical protein